MTELFTSKNALIERYSGDAQFRFLGDKQLASRYVPFARKLLGVLRNQLSLGEINTGIRQIILEDGAYIRVSYNGTTHSIFIDVRLVIPTAPDLWKAFVESGSLDLRPYRGLYQAPEPAHQYYTQELLMAYAIGDTEIQYTAPDSGAWLDWLNVYLENSDGQINITKIRNDLTSYIPGCDSESVIRDELSKRLLFYVSDVCAASGKLKLYFQSHIGKNKSLYAADTMLLLAWTSSIFSTYGLYTANNGLHYLVRLSTNNLTLYPLYRSRLAEFLARWLEKAEAGQVPMDFETRTKIEAYLLSETYFYTDLDNPTPNVLRGTTYAYVGNESINFDLSSDTTLWYGWKGNWKGNLWDIVIHKGILNDGQTAYKWRTAQHWQVEILETLDRQTNTVTFSASLTKLEEGNWTPHKGREIVWIPWRNEAGVMDMTFIDWYEDATDLSDTDVPIYCWYDSQDRLLELRHKRLQRPDQPYVSLVESGRYFSNYVIAPNELHDEAIGYTDCWQSGFYTKLGDPSNSQDILFKSNVEEDEFLGLKYIGGQVDLQDFYIADSWYDEGCESYFGAWGMWAQPDANSELGWSCGPSLIYPITPWEQDSCAEGPYSDLRYVYKENYTYYLEYNTLSSHSIELASVLVIPHYSSEAAYLGKKQYKYGASSFTIDWSPLSRRTNLIGSVANSATGLHVVNTCGIRHPYSTGSKTWENYSIKVSLVTKHESLVLVEQTDVQNLPSEWSHIWTVSTQNPLLGAALYVTNGVTGEYYYNGDDRSDSISWELCTSDKLPLPSEGFSFPVGWF